MKKGFTLIELLAVIIVIGIVAVIASPLISSVLERARRDAFEDSIYGLIKAVNVYKADQGFNINVTFTVTEGVISPTLDIKGSVNGNGVLQLNEDGEIALTIEYKTWCATKDYNESVVTVADATCVQNSDTSNANTPELLTNMVPIRWDGSKWVRADKRNPSSAPWYSYGTTSGTRNWANAVFVKEVGTKLRDYYLSDAAIGKEVAEADILAYFVWIPRFNYAIPAGSGARTINLRFESGLPSKSTGNAIGTSYLTHPAFTLGTNELTGIWVSKFEVTGTNSEITIKPNLPAVTSQPLISFNYSVGLMQLNNNIYGFVPSKIDLHIMKNNEWGAISYLTNSIYGKNDEVWKNPSTTYITGCAGASIAPTGSSGCSYAYNTTNGVQASTTGNIYGIYDMVGGALDIVMGNFNKNSGLSGFNTFPNTKYYNNYITLDTATACDGSPCLGHALSETAGWYSGQTTVVNSSLPWYARGSHSGSSDKSIFGYSSVTGGSASNTSMHLTLIKK